MGLGDWILATSQVRELNKRTGRAVVVVDHHNRPRWSEVFDNNPRIARRHSPETIPLLNCGGNRPYIASKSTAKWTWKKWDISPGELWLSEREKDWARQCGGTIIVEPNTKLPDGNKAWRFDRWQALVDRVGPLNFIQTGGEGSRRLVGVPFLATTFRQAAAVLAVSKGFVGSEGAMHHAAACFGTPAVVLWSEFIAPEFTGYYSQTNIRHAVGWCGNRAYCLGCKESMDAITVDEVCAALEVL